MNLEIIMPWVIAANALLTLGGIVYAFLTSGSKAAHEAIAKMDERLDRHHSRLQTIEGNLTHMPDKDAVHRLELTLKDMQTEMAKVGASAEQSARTASRVETYLLERGK